jgi:glycyl-tRNA synthetase beta chain
MEFGRRPEAMSLAAANKRVANILRKAQEETGATPGGQVDPACFELPAEHDLAAALDAAVADTATSRANGDYTAVLARLAQLQGPVDAFFDKVLVNAEDPRVRTNRLALLARLQAQFSAVADIARL